MKIRSISYFFSGDPRSKGDRVAKAGAFLRTARERFDAAGLHVQTVRLVLEPMGSLGDLTPDAVCDYAVLVEELCRAAAIDFATVGALRPADLPALWDTIPGMLTRTERIFAAGLVVDDRGVHLDSVRRAAEIIHRNASASTDGFQNLRFAALGKVAPGVPFLPAAYHDGSAEHFSLATESADVAVDAFRDASTLEDARDAFLRGMHAVGAKIVATSQRVATEHGIAFGGIDFSLAPFPRQEDSIGAALESLGLPALGRPGSTASCAFLASCLDAVQLPRRGFCGLFLPVLEDEVLTRRAAEGHLGIAELLLASTVCGTGLDTVPLPGAISAEEISAILLDMAALSVRLDKPLTARLMPIPGKKAGDRLDFDFPYFASGQVLDHSAKSLHGLLAGGGTLPITPRLRR
jgi:hypothetical protein